MLFNSFEFIAAFLPITLFGYFLLNKYRQFEIAKIWLLFASLFFYGWWNPHYVYLIITSIFINYGFHQYLKSDRNSKVRRLIMIIGVVLNLGVLGYYKYADFFILNFNLLSGNNFNLIHIILPLGISFFTFQQIAFLVDSYKGEVDKISLTNYALFVSFFPQLIAGPIVHHVEMMPQFLDEKQKKVNLSNVITGIFVFNMGLAKKVVIADTFGKIANAGYASSSLLGTWDSWLTSFAYTVQLYFDFSGYSDMAIGIGLLFNIKLPDNFFSPHKSDSIQQFYRRWHITLSRFLREYIYIPLGGNKGGQNRTYFNLFMTFLIGGLWHGANWTFVFWGALNGAALIVQRFYQKLNWGMPKFMAVGITFLFVMICRVFFRANDWSVAMDVLSSMIGLNAGNGVTLFSTFFDFPIWIIGLVLMYGANTTEIREKFQVNNKYSYALIGLILVNLLFMNSTMKQDFLYFDF